MNIESIIVKNFRSFGSEPTKINFDSKTTILVGGNGTGKTVLLLALQRMFGISSNERKIRNEDFHRPQTKGAKQETDLYIEILLAFPELETDTPLTSSVPDFFRSMSIADESNNLKVRLRLEALWEADGTIDGHITSNFYSINTFENEVGDENKISLRPYERSKIQLIYIPANRNASSEATQFLKGRLWKAINWSSNIKENTEEKILEINEIVLSQTAIIHIKEILTKQWNILNKAETYSSPVIQAINPDFEFFSKNIEILLAPDELDQNKKLSELSDGQNSLFHLAMVATAISIESEFLKNKSEIFTEDLKHFLPYLTIIALEEPENNLSPYYLSKIMQQIITLVTQGGIQSIISSHSASILSRVEPENVRYFRLNKQKNSAVKEIILPHASHEAHMYVKEAIKAYPELYFARFVVLGEGDSEEIIIPKLAEASGLHMDRSFVAMVPLGGRHVNHFWRLLNDLEIPYATLLDLDFGRSGAGVNRIKYVVDQLEKIGKKFIYNGIALNQVWFNDKNNLDCNLLNELLSCSILSNIFFCAPLDLDYSMLNSFTAKYKTCLSEGSRGPNAVTTDEQKNDLWKAVLKPEGEFNLFEKSNVDTVEYFQWYRYLFLGQSKPIIHLEALSKITPGELADKAPNELKRLIQTIKFHIAN